MRNSIYLMAMCLLWIYQLVVAETNEPRSYTALSSALQTNSNSALVCQVFGTITSDTTWDPAICDSYVVTDDVTIIRPLVIKPGTLIRFDNQKTLTIRSKLIARGTEARPIIFTSNVGQNKGDWGYISFTDSSIDAQFDVAGNFIDGSIIQYAVIEYAGGGNAADIGALRIEASSPYLDHNILRHNNVDGIHVWSGEGIRITNNTISDNGVPGSTNACGIHYRSGSGLLVISGNAIYNNTGTGVYVLTGGIGSANTITGNTISENTGGIHILNNQFAVSTANLSSNTITHNKATGLLVDHYNTYGSITAIIDKNIVSTNTSSGNGAGIHIHLTIPNSTHIADTRSAGERSGLAYGPIVTLTNNTITNNTASANCGGIYAEYGTDVTISGNTITGNAAAIKGGGICGGGTNTINDNLIANNYSTAGAGVWMISGGAVTIRGNTISNNTASADGGGIYSEADRGTIADNVITGNSVTQSNGRGAGIYLSNGCRPAIDSNNLYGNTSYKGSEIYNGNLAGGSNVNAANNWWGTTDFAVIESQVWHHPDDASLGIVDYVPFRNTPIPSTPTPTPTSTSTAMDTVTSTPSSTCTATQTPTDIWTATPTLSPSMTSSPIQTAVRTATATRTPISTPARQRIYLPYSLKAPTPTFTPSPTPTPTAPRAPYLEAITNVDHDRVYTVHWVPSSNADRYILEESRSDSFSDIRQVYTGAHESWTVPIPGKTPGTYYYRVKAGNAGGESAWSNTQTVTIHPLFVGLATKWDATGFIRGSEYYNVGYHSTVNCDALTDADTIRCHWRNWYDPNPNGWPEETYTSYYSVSTGVRRSSTRPPDPSWKWSRPWRLDYGSQFSDGQIISLDGQRFRVSGPFWGYTVFGVSIQYWEMVNLDTFVFWDGGGDWNQYVHAGEAKLRYLVNGTLEIVFDDILRRDYLKGNPTGDTVQYIRNLTASSTIPPSVITTGTAIDWETPIPSMSLFGGVAEYEK